jgi:non-specific protein-tyrosine kinase
MQADLITLSDPRSRAAEAYRTVRTNLTFAAVDDPIQALVVTSPAPGEGKSVVVANLAVAMAQGQRSTLLVDADLRRPALHEIFGIPNDPGLTSMIFGEGDMGDLPAVDVGIEGLAVVPSGPLPPNPADILGSQRMKAAIEKLRASAEIVLFDAPPVIAATDAAVLGTQLDGVLLVVQSGRTRRDQAQRAKELLERVHVRVVGAVLSDAPRDSVLGGY